MGIYRQPSWIFHYENLFEFTPIFLPGFFPVISSMIYQQLHPKFPVRIPSEISAAILRNSMFPHNSPGCLAEMLPTFLSKNYSWFFQDNFQKKKSKISPRTSLYISWGITANVHSNIFQGFLVRFPLEIFQRLRLDFSRFFFGFLPIAPPKLR